MTYLLPVKISVIKITQAINKMAFPCLMKEVGVENKVEKLN